LGLGLRLVIDFLLAGEFYQGEYCTTQIRLKSGGWFKTWKSCLLHILQPNCSPGNLHSPL